MAPQQNSTLIDENLEECPSMLNAPEGIHRCSPILPLKCKENHDKNNNNNNYNSNQQKKVNKIGKWEFTNKELSHYYKSRHYWHGSYQSGRSRHSGRSRSISLYGINSTVEKCDQEITVWIDDEPRYISGVTKKTTCNDIIKALIDDEISNGNHEFCQPLKVKDGAASRDYSDYVITECWRGIERSYDGKMRILPVWRAWSCVHNEIRLSLKHQKDMQDPVKSIKTNSTLSSIRHYVCKWLNFRKNKNCKSKSKMQTKSQTNKEYNSVQSKREENENQLGLKGGMLFFNHNAKLYKKTFGETCSNNMGHATKTSDMNIINRGREIPDRKIINKVKLYKLSETRSSIRKRMSSGKRRSKKSSRSGSRDGCIIETNNFLRKRKDSHIRWSVRNKLAQKSAEMNELYEREYALTKQLTNRCKMYKLHNEMYTTNDRNLEISVGQIQQSIEAFTKDIIATEHELLEVKNEIKQDISIINNLKRLTINSDASVCDMPTVVENARKPESGMKQIKTANTEVKTNDEQMLFVDNIYEFCDNNASMLV